MALLHQKHLLHKLKFVRLKWFYSRFKYAYLISFKQSYWFQLSYLLTVVFLGWIRSFAHSGCLGWSRMWHIVNTSHPFASSIWNIDDSVHSSKIVIRLNRSKSFSLWFSFLCFKHKRLFLLSDLSTHFRSAFSSDFRP